MKFFATNIKTNDQYTLEFDDVQIHDDTVAAVISYEQVETLEHVHELIATTSAENPFMLAWPFDMMRVYVKECTKINDDHMQVNFEEIHGH